MFDFILLIVNNKDTTNLQDYQLFIQLVLSRTQVKYLSDSIEYSDVTTVVNLFDNAYLSNFRNGESKQDFYCGITKDLEQRRVQHKIEDYIIHKKCSSFEIACSVEEELQKRGYDTGKQTGNGVEDSTYVYMYRKTLTSEE